MKRGVVGNIGGSYKLWGLGDSNYLCKLLFLGDTFEADIRFIYISLDRHFVIVNILSFLPS